MGKKVEVYTIIAHHVKAIHVKGKELRVKKSKWDDQRKYTFPKHSITLLRWNTGTRIMEVSKGNGTKLDTRKLAWGANTRTAVKSEIAKSL
jgi:alpha-N-arabinofuranosidase